MKKISAVFVFWLFVAAMFWGGIAPAGLTNVFVASAAADESDEGVTVDEGTGRSREHGGGGGGRPGGGSGGPGGGGGKSSGGTGGKEPELSGGESTQESITKPENNNPHNERTGGRRNNNHDSSDNDHRTRRTGRTRTVETTGTGTQIINSNESTDIVPMSLMITSMRTETAPEEEEEEKETYEQAAERIEKQVKEMEAEITILQGELDAAKTALKDSVLGAIEQLRQEIPNLADVKDQESHKAALAWLEAAIRDLTHPDTKQPLEDADGFIEAMKLYGEGLFAQYQEIKRFAAELKDYRDWVAFQEALADFYAQEDFLIKQDQTNKTTYNTPEKQRERYEDWLRALSVGNDAASIAFQKYLDEIWLVENADRSKSVVADLDDAFEAWKVYHRDELSVIYSTDLGTMKNKNAVTNPPNPADRSVPYAGNFNEGTAWLSPLYTSVEQLRATNNPDNWYTIYIPLENGYEVGDPNHLSDTVKVEIFRFYDNFWVFFDERITAGSITLGSGGKSLTINADGTTTVVGNVPADVTPSVIGNGYKLSYDQINAIANVAWYGPVTITYSFPAGSFIAGVPELAEYNDTPYKSTYTPDEFTETANGSLMSNKDLAWYALNFPEFAYRNVVPPTPPTTTPPGDDPTPPPPGGSDPSPTPGPMTTSVPPTTNPTTITDPTVPLSENPFVDIFDEEVPLTDFPTVEIEDQEVPLGTMPQTGEGDMIWIMLIGLTLSMIVTGGSLAFLRRR